jgi:uncharacterized protein DUF4145
MDEKAMAETRAIEPEQPTFQVRKAECSNCKGQRNCDVVGRFEQRGGDDDFQWSTDWYLLKCRGCDEVFVQTVSTNSEDYEHSYGELGESEANYKETIRYWPGLSRRERPDWFSEAGIEGNDHASLDDAMSEVYGALDANLATLAAIGIRTTFDVAAEILEIDGGLSFAQKLQALVDEGHIGSVDKDRVAALVDAGSASAHRGWQPTPADLDTMMGILEHFVFETVVQKSRRERLNRRAAEMRKRVPPKPRRKAKKAGKTS